jgi:hydroxymethylglutaryl-CoA reductase
MRNSRLPGFYKKSVDERINILNNMCNFTDEEITDISSQGALTISQADKMIENAIGIYPIPLGLGLNFLLNGKDYLVPMAIEEPSVVASASYIAKIVRDAGGFTTEATERIMIGQIQVIGCSDFQVAKQELLKNKEQLLELANSTYPSLVARGGGAEDLEVRLLNEESNSRFSQMLVVQLFVNTCDAMGANMINTMVEALAPYVEEITGGKVYLRILSNYVDRCLARARCVIPPYLLASDGYSGEEVRDGIVYAYEFAASDKYRAVTHNKGVMNGIDSVVIASGNDWRAIEAAAHAHACRFGNYGSMTEWSVDKDGNLVGEIELPMPVGIVGGSIQLHPIVKITHKILNVSSAAELAQVIVAVGLAQNLGALKALATDGIQKGHMALHARSVAMTAGAAGDLIDIIAQQLVEAKDIRVSKAEELLNNYR